MCKKKNPSIKLTSANGLMAVPPHLPPRYTPRATLPSYYNLGMRAGMSAIWWYWLHSIQTVVRVHLVGSMGGLMLGRATGVRACIVAFSGWLRWMRSVHWRQEASKEIHEEQHRSYVAAGPTICNGPQASVKLDPGTRYLPHCRSKH